MDRDRYIEVLALLADPEAQLQYEKTVPIAGVPAELICMWFDDLNASRLDPDLSRSDTTTLREFTTYFAARVDGLPAAPDVSALHSNPMWAEIVQEAKSALHALAGRGI